MQRAGIPLTSNSPYEISISAAIYTHPLARCLESCLGMVAYRFWEQYVQGSRLHWTFWTGIEITALMGASLWMSRYFWYVASLLPSSWLVWWMGTSGSCWVFALIIVVLAKGRGLVGRALCSRLLVWLGEISFSIYMVHQLLFKIFVWRLDITSEIVLLPAIVAVAAFAHHVIERPGQALIAGTRTAIR
jgi:peptidoglycan/LPS O-acetylase OafA/YrhL